MMVEFPSALFERLRAGDVVLCAGVRFAATSGMPAWDGLLRKMADKLGKDGASLVPLIDSGYYLTAAGYLKRKLGNESLGQVLKEAYRNGEALPKTYELLGEIPFHAALSTGYDTLLERALKRGGGAPKVYSYTDGAVLRLAEDLKHFVVKAHGYPDEPDKLVLNRLDYKRLVGPHHAYRAFVEDLYRTRTLLLIGYHANDPDFLLLLDRLVATFGDAVSDHYAVVPGLTGPEAEELYANHRLRVIPYDEGDDWVTSLTSVLESFHEAWRSKGMTADEAHDPVQWLTTQLAPVSARIDVVAGEGLTLTEGRLNRIRDTAAGVELSALDGQTLCRLGNVRLYLGDATGAIACYGAALQADSGLAIAHLNMHHAEAEAGDYGRALEHLKKATELDDSLRVVPKRYELKAVVGRGTTGTVYQARDTQENRDVTVKVLRVSYVREHVSPERWLSETEALVLLEHPNIARIYDAAIEGGRCLIVAESLSGRNLGQALREGGPLSPERAAQIMAQVCEALEYAHGNDVLHLDVMPSNIFLRDDGGVTLMDFRSGRAQKGRHVTVKKGSEGFQAPELLAGAGADVRADVYSLGATLYNVLTGKLPIGSFPRLSEINPAARRFESLVTRAMRALPDERPPSVADFAKILAGSGEAIHLPERDDDLAGWIEVLHYQPDNPQAIDALSRLESGYRAAKDWDNLVAMLLGRVEIEADGARRLEMLREVARVFELEVGDLGKAFTALSAAFREDHTSVEIRRDLERLAGATGMWNELLHEYSALVQGLRDAKLACDWWVHMGHLYASELGHDDYAAAAFGQALALDANRADALVEMAEVVKRKGDHKEYARLLNRQVQLEDNAARKLELLRDLARTYAKDLASDEEAILCYRRMLEIDPASRGAIDALEKLYRGSEMWEELAELLRGRIDVTDQAGDQLAFRRTLAALYADQLEQPERAIEQYEAILAAAPDDAPALHGLERLYDATGRNAEYLKVLDRRIAAASTDDEKVALYRRLAAEWEEQSGGKARAAEYLEKAAELGGATEESTKALIRIYWELKSFDKLAAAYEAQSKIVERPADRAGLYAALGKVYDEHLQDSAKAADTYNKLLAVDPDSKIALAALARVYEQSKSWGQAVETLERLGPKQDDVDLQVECYQRIGQIQFEQLKQLEQAESNLIKALELKDTHTPALLSLARLNNERKDFGKAARFMREAARNSANELERVKRYFEAGALYQDKLGDEQTAIEVYDELLGIDPEHVEAGERLVDLLEKRGDAERARPVLEMLVRKADTKERGRLLRLNVRLGDIYLVGGARDKAIEAYRGAYEVDPTDMEALNKLADQLYEAGQQAEAGKLYQSLLVHKRDSMEPGQIVQVFMRLGEIRAALGEHTKALNMFEKAHEADPNNAEVLDRLIKAHEAKGDHEAVLRAKRAALKVTKDEEEQLRLLEEIGDLLIDQLKRVKEGVISYEQALSVRPNVRRLLNKALDAYIGQKRWDSAIEVLKKLEENETDPEHSYRLHYTAAIILRDELHQEKEAARHLDLALEADPTNRRAFEALEKLFTEQGNFEGLVKAYRRMLKRLPDSTPVAEQVALWQQVGEICKNQLLDARGAIVAFEVAAKLDPTDIGRQEDLAKLYASAGEGAFVKAIAVNQRLLRHNPMRLEGYRELQRIYSEQGELDKCWCVTGVLSLLKHSGEQERKFYEQYKPKQHRKLSRRFSDDLWRDSIYHPTQQPVLNELFRAIAPVVAPMAVRPRKSYGIKAGEQLKPQEDSRAYAAAYRYVTSIFDLRPDEAYVRGDVQQPLLLVLAGDAEHADSLLWVNPSLLDAERTETELIFRMARVLALLRPELLLAFATPSPVVLRAFVLACLKLVDPHARIAGDVEQIDRLVDVLRSDLPSRHVAALGARAEEIRAAAGDGQVEQWLSGVEHTVARAALLACDDLELAAKLVVDGKGQLAPKERLAQLFAYAVSEEYFAARATLGMKVA